MSEIKNKPVWVYTFVILGCLLYAVGTHFFVFPCSLPLGGVSGLSVILNSFMALSAGKILVILDMLLLISAFAVLGKTMGIRSTVGSLACTFFIGGFDLLFPLEAPVIQNPILSGAVGAVFIAVGGGMLFFVDASSGGTDIIALIIKKYRDIDIGKALLLVDFLIVVAGGILSGWLIAAASVVGILIKTLGTDLVIKLITPRAKKGGSSD